MRMGIDVWLMPERYERDAQHWLRSSNPTAIRPTRGSPVLGRRRSTKCGPLRSNWRLRQRRRFCTRRLAASRNVERGLSLSDKTCRSCPRPQAGARLGSQIASVAVLNLCTVHRDRRIVECNRAKPDRPLPRRGQQPKRRNAVTRAMLLSVAFAAMMSMAAAPAPATESVSLNFNKITQIPLGPYSRPPKSNQLGTSPSGKSGKSAKGFIADSFGFGVEREMKESRKARNLRRKSRR